MLVLMLVLMPLRTISLCVQAARTALELFVRAVETPQRERDLLKQVPDPLLSGTMIGNVKLSMPGLTQKMSQVKQQKKQAAKADK